MDPYEVLGVPKSASQDDIKRAFKRKAIENHPDKNNGDKSKEDLFKQVNEAYSILSDPKKKEEFDMFGTVGGPGGGPGGPGFDPFADIFSSFFGGGGPMGGPGGPGFSFAFGGPPRHQQRVKRCDVIDIKLTLSDMYYGTTKKVEFEMMDKCQKCSGTGANDPSNIVKCMSCNGTGTIHQRLNQFMMTASTCPSCAGKGEMRTGKACGSCKGNKAIYRKRAFELKLSKGLPENREMVMEGKGAYDPEGGHYNDIMFRFHNDIPQDFKLNEHTGDVTYTHPITIDDLLGGFDHDIKIYDEVFTIRSAHYFNPDKKIIKITEKGIFTPARQSNGDLLIQFKVNWTEGEKLVKYSEIMQKIYKRQVKSISTKEENVITVTKTAITEEKE